MAQIGQAGLRLIKDLDRSQDTILSYNESAMSNCVEEISSLYQKNVSDVARFQSNPQPSSALLPIYTRQAAIEHTRRCMLVYCHRRQRQLALHRWLNGAVLPPALNECLHESERTWFRQYAANLAEFQRSLGDHGGVDLTVGVDPPRTLFVQVRCVENYGEFETSEGAVVILTRDSMHSLPRQDCEHLIKQGVLEIL